MKTIDLALQKLDGVLISIIRNTQEGWYEIEIGLKKSWVYSDSDDICCNIITEGDTGKLVRIAPKKYGIVIDDLIEFIEIIISTNKKIADKEQEFADRMEQMKVLLEKEASKFYQELDELKENSFNALADDYEKKVGKPRKKLVNKTPENTKIDEVVNNNE